MTDRHLYIDKLQVSTLATEESVCLRNALDDHRSPPAAQTDHPETHTGLQRGTLSSPANGAHRDPDPILDLYRPRNPPKST